MSGTITYPIELPANINMLYQAGMPFDFVISWSNAYRSLDFIEIVQGPDVLPVGTFMQRGGIPATSPGDVDYILCYPVDTRGGPDRVTVVSRDAEVNDAYLAYGTLDRAAVNTHLRDNNNIIVREGILPSAMNGNFTGQGQPPGWTMFSQPGAPHGDGRVGVETYQGGVVQPVPDPSPGVNSVLADGSVGPTPSPEQRATPPSPPERR